MLKLEFLLVLAAIALAFTMPTLGSRGFLLLEENFRKIARRRGLAVLLAGLFAVLLRVALLPVLPVPIPSNPDEFSHLLLADTFAHGRVANPTSPMWVHFETIHVNQIPTYSSMMFPAQGLILAAGEKLGHPFMGVLLSLGLMCAALCWMLQAYVPESWALLGVLLAAVRFGTFSYWANSYMGGAVAACGAALVLGGAMRIKQSFRTIDALALGLGFGILANTRPFEGFFLSAPVMLWLLWQSKQSRKIKHDFFLKFAMPLVLVIACLGSAMFYYCWRTTGNPLKTPYIENIQTYNPVPYFPWQSPKTLPQYRHAEMRDFYTVFLGSYNVARDHPFYLLIIKGIRLWSFFLGPALFLPLVMVVNSLWRCVAKSGEYRLLLIVLCFGLGAAALPVYFFPHYAAPLTPVILALVVLAMQHAKELQWRNKPVGLFLVRAIPSITILSLVAATFSSSLGISMPVGLPQHLALWYSPAAQFPERAEVLASLTRMDGPQLVMVRYKPDRDLVKEWVYNEADIDIAKVVWAREMGPLDNEELLKYFANRKVWLLEADEKPPRLSPYPETTTAIARRAQ